MSETENNNPAEPKTPEAAEQEVHRMGTAAARGKAGKKGRHGVALKETPSTGHEWDGIKEYDNPLPRWWLWTFYVCIIWAIGYMVMYPAIPLVNGPTLGVLDTNNRKVVAAEIARFDDANGPIRQQLAEIPLNDIQNDAAVSDYANHAGAAVFRTWCAQCHGAGAGGAKGYPALVDNDWLWGGSLDDIYQTIKHGIRSDVDDDTRYSEMPRFGVDELLERDQIDQVASYVLSLSGHDHDAAKASEGATVFADNCASCHMEDGSGDRSQGAPNLKDAIWLYGDDKATLTRIITQGPYGVMPAWDDRLSEDEIRAVAVYVHRLGGGEAPAAE